MVRQSFIVELAVLALATVFFKIIRFGASHGFFKIIRFHASHGFFKIIRFHASPGFFKIIRFNASHGCVVTTGASAQTASTTIPPLRC